MERNWIDISQPLTNDMTHWPGDTPFSYELTYSKSQSGSANIGQITTSLHSGTHVDAPYHYDMNGEKIDQLNLEHFIGKAIVIDVSNEKKLTADVLRKIKWNHQITRVLLRTSLPNNPKKFPETMPIIDHTVASFLAEKDVKLLGVDLPSVDAIDSKDLPTHHALAKHGIYILENMMLDHVTPGIYDMIALPLAIQGADGSPVRAVIRPLSVEE